MAVALSPLQRIVNISWGGGLGFLFISTSGVYTSKDGDKWGKVSEGFSANAVAYGRKNWIAATDGGIMLSEDRGKTWESVSGPGCDQLVFAGPSPTENPEEDSGAFYALDVTDVEGEGDVYSSSDGQSWSKVLSIPSPDFGIESGVNGYSPENLQTQGSTVVLTATQFVTVPPADPELGGRYTRAARYTGSDGSITGPSVYGPEGSASNDNPKGNTGAGAARDESTGATYINYLEVEGVAFGVNTYRIAVNGSAVATSTSTGGGDSGSHLSGGTFMAAADGEGWFLTNELVFPDLDLQIGACSASGERALFLDAGFIGSVTGLFMGNTCALPAKGDRRAVFCTVAAANDRGGLWVNKGGGWNNTLQSSGGAVGVGKITTSENSGE